MQATLDFFSLIPPKGLYLHRWRPQYNFVAAVRWTHISEHTHGYVVAHIIIHAQHELTYDTIFRDPLLVLARKTGIYVVCGALCSRAALSQYCTPFTAVLCNIIYEQLAALLSGTTVCFHQSTTE